MLFRSIISQQDIANGLIQMHQSGRLPHALLFLGPTGNGKLSLALAFAQYLLCDNPTDSDSCGNCHNCLKAVKNIHPDIHFSFPTIGSKAVSDQFLKQWRAMLEQSTYFDLIAWLQAIGAENKQGNITKEECVNIIKKLSLKTFEGKRKILIMWLPEYLGKEGNRLLKLIEEPPEDTVFLLVAENQERILNTILSRCQLIKVNPLSDEAIKEGLNLHLGMEEGAAASISYLANGSFSEALKLANQKENNNAHLFLEWMRKSYKGNGIEMVQWVDHFSTIGRENQKHFLQYALHFMREYLILKVTGQDQLRLQDKERSTAHNLIHILDVYQVEKIVELFSDCFYFIERNANPKVLFLNTSIQLNRIIKSKATIAS